MRCLGVQDIGEGPSLCRHASFNLPSAHPVVVEQVFFLERRTCRCDRLGRRHHVVHGVAKMPTATEPRVVVAGRRGLRRHIKPARAKRLGDLVVTPRCRVARPRRLREKAQHVVVVGAAPHGSVPPEVVHDATAHAGLVLEVEALPHRVAHLVERTHQQWIEVRTDRVREGRHPDTARERSALVLVIHDLREPVVIKLTRHGLGLDLRQHVPVTVVVVTDVVMVKLRHRRHLELTAHVRHVPVSDDVEAVRVHVGHKEQDRVLTDVLRLGRLIRHEMVRHLRHHLTVRYFGSMQTAIDPDDRLPFLGQGSSVLFGQNRTVPAIWITGVRERARDLLVTVQEREIFWRRNRRKVKRLTERTLADLLKHHAIRGCREGFEVLRDRPVIGQLEILARSEADHVGRQGHIRSVRRARMGAQRQ